MLHKIAKRFDLVLLCHFVAVLVVLLVAVLVVFLLAVFVVLLVAVLVVLLVLLAVVYFVLLVVAVATIFDWAGDSFHLLHRLPTFVFIGRGRLFVDGFWSLGRRELVHMTDEPLELLVRDIRKVGLLLFMQKHQSLVHVGILVVLV